MTPCSTFSGRFSSFSVYVFKNQFCVVFFFTGRLGLCLAIVKFCPIFMSFNMYRKAFYTIFRLLFFLNNVKIMLLIACIPFLKKKEFQIALHQ